MFRYVGALYTPEQFDAYCEVLPLTWRPRFIVLHHTGRPSLAEWPKVRGAQRMENLKTYYEGLGWSAGPHLIIASEGIYIFSPLTSPGVHATSWNAMSWGVEVVGNFSTEEIGMSQWVNLVSALATLHELGNFPQPWIKLHKSDPRTTHKGCPGGRLADKLPQLEATIEEVIARRNPGEHREDRAL